MENLEVTKDMMATILRKMANIEQSISKQGTAIFEMKSEHRSQMSMNQSQDDGKNEGGIDLSPQFAKHSAKHIDIKFKLNNLMGPLKDNDGYKEINNMCRPTRKRQQAIATRKIIQ
jgi:hypothetical protein